MTGAAVLVGAATGNRAGAMGTAAALFTVGYHLRAARGVVAWLEPVRVLSAFYLYSGSTPIAHGLAVTHDLVLVGLCLGAVAAAVALFDRRDLPA